MHHTFTSSKVNALHKSMVFRFIWKRKLTSRPEIIKTFGFSKSTVSEIVRDLAEEGLITASGFSNSASLGRKAELLSINPNGPKIVSLLLKDTGEIDAALLNLDGNIVKRIGAVLPWRAPSPKEAVECILETLNKVLVSPTILGIGIGVPGIVDHHTGRIEYSAHFNWTDFPLGEMIQEKLPYPVFIENRTIAATLGEMWYGKALGSRDFICIHCGDVFAAGIVIGEKIHRGGLKGAGEIGHISIHRADPQTCSCGRKGCAETIVALPSIMQRLGKVYHSEKESLAFLREYCNVPEVKTLLEEAFEVIGEVTAILINTLAPEKVIFTGTLSKIDAPLFLHTIERVVSQKALYPLVHRVALEISSLKEGEEVLWGAAVVMERLFATNIL